MLILNPASVGVTGHIEFGDVESINKSVLERIIQSSMLRLIRDIEINLVSDEDWTYQVRFEQSLQAPMIICFVHFSSSDIFSFSFKAEAMRANDAYDRALKKIRTTFWSQETANNEKSKAG